MASSRLGMLGSLSALAAALAFSCGTDEGTSPDVHADGGLGPTTTYAGESSGGQTSASGSASAGTSSGGNVALGGEGGGLAFGGAPLQLGEGGYAGAPVTSSGEQLVLCDRLVGLVTHATAVSKAFSKATYADCRVNWVVPLQQTDLVAYKNRLVTWSLQLWGCQGEPVTEFALAYQQPELSRGDATILIEQYLSTVDAELNLSPPERDEMQAALTRLAAPLIVSESSEPSRPDCALDPGSGGAGGVNGSGSVPAGGAGGAPAPGSGQAGLGGGT